MKVYMNSEYIIKWLTIKCWSQNFLAKKIGISSGYVSQLIHGKRRPSPKLRQRILEVLQHVEFDEIFIIKDYRPR